MYPCIAVRQVSCTLNANAIVYATITIVIAALIKLPQNTLKHNNSVSYDFRRATSLAQRNLETRTLTLI